MSGLIRVAIRADAGASLGTGHFSRATAVVDALSAAGDTEIVLVTSKEGAGLVPAYFPSNVPRLELASDQAGPAAAMKLLHQHGFAPDVIYLDQYGEVPEWEEQAADSGVRLIVLDDLDAARHADVIIRPHDGDGDSTDRIVLRGPAYLPLSRSITTLAGQGRLRKSNPRLRLNVCFGGTDPSGETAKALAAVGDLDGLDIDVIIGPGATIDPALVQEAGRMRQVNLHRAPSQARLAGLLSDADFALGAGGVMLWERLCLGIPSLVISVAANQRGQIDYMVAAGAIRFVGDHTAVTSGRIAQAVSKLAADEPGRVSLAETGRKLVDGRGAIRLAAWIRALALDSRDVRLDDAEDLLAWRTDDRNWKHNWAQAVKPALASHMAWLKTKLADPACVFRILMLRDEAVGVVRFDLNEDVRSAYLSIYLVPEWHGRKMGLPVYLAAERQLRQAHKQVRQIISRIHGSNSPSEQLHRDAGFEIEPSKCREGWLDAQKLLG